MTEVNLTNPDNSTTAKSNFIRLLFIILIISIIISLYVAKTITVSGGTVASLPNKQSLIITPLVRKIKCIVYLKDRAGRLGNRMFITASAYALAHLHLCHLYLSPDIIKELKEVFLFNLSSILLSSSTFESITNDTLQPMRRIIMSVGCQYRPELTRPNAIPQMSIVEFQGYWQSYLHFAKYGDELREYIFVAAQSILMNVWTFFNDLYQQKLGVKPQFPLKSHQSLKADLAQSDRTTWIGIHIRRSDFVGEKFSSSDEYIFKSIEFYTTRYPNAHFIVASDDKDYCENLFRNRSNIFLTPRAFSVGDDLITLSLCQHSIITGGTFGWWAAYLANGEVVHDTVYPSGCERREYYYPPWFLIDGNVRAQKDSNYVLK